MINISVGVLYNSVHWWLLICAQKRAILLKGCLKQTVC